ncbi:MAG TPA: preprotein translocase subunit SecG [Planctomycetes bacterium]|nr:preprotein translocase subunit SecG [Planctomycetota bacterium]
MVGLLMTLLTLTCLFLIGLILIQRGRGGGLAGAFGGLGGQSAFGTKAGDVFTRLTIGVAAVWILLCMAALWTIGGSKGPMKLGGPSQGASQGVERSAGGQAGGGAAEGGPESSPAGESTPQSPGQ